MNAPYQLTGDGFESHFQVNFLSQYLLTRLLMDTLLQSPQPKVIHICSASAEKGRIHDTDILERAAKVQAPDYDAMTAYRESKLAQQAAIMALSRMDMFRAVCWSLVHPGVVNTNLFYRNQGAWYKWVMKPFVWAGYAVGFFKTPKQGADTAIYLAESGDYPSGGYWHNRKPLDPNPISLDAAYGQALLAWTNKIIAV
jgi:NAD(P)-dependent dehydrogenase (short-subunit alcohol dehydrogenase family)